jgi:hypothetical protein
MLKQVHVQYFSLNGEEQDIFVVDRLQLVQEGSSSKRVSFEYYLTRSDRCCRNAFKIALAVGNMRLNRIQQRYNSSDSFVDTVSEDVIGKGIVGNHAVN